MLSDLTTSCSSVIEGPSNCHPKHRVLISRPWPPIIPASRSLYVRVLPGMRSIRPYTWQRDHADHAFALARAFNRGLSAPAEGKGPNTMTMSRPWVKTHLLVRRSAYSGYRSSMAPGMLKHRTRTY